MASVEEKTVSKNLKANIRSFVTKENLTKALQNYLHDENAKLDDFQVDLATDEVQGFLSCILRVKLFYQRDGKQQTKPVIVKRMPISNVQKDTVKQTGVFAKEAKAYMLIVKDMEAVIDKTIFKVPVPECYHVFTDGKSDELILEDLNESGFKIRKLKELFDRPHFDVVLKALATFHALSVVVEKGKGQPLNEVYDCLTESMFTSYMYKTMSFFKDGIEGIVEFAKLIPEYEAIIPKLQKKCDSLWGNLRELTKPGNSLNVILHGDPWCQNMMFRYENEHPVEVKLIDLQIVRYGSPVSDLLYLIHQSAFRSMRDKHIDEMLEVYHSQFCAILKGAGVYVPNFSLQDLKDEYNSKRIYGVFWSCITFPYLYMSEMELPKDYDNTDEFEKLFSESKVSQQIQQFKVDAEYRDNLKPEIEEMIEVMGLL